MTNSLNNMISMPTSCMHVLCITNVIQDNHCVNYAATESHDQAMNMPAAADTSPLRIGDSSYIFIISLFNAL